jgi:hypothetical protein
LYSILRKLANLRFEYPIRTVSNFFRKFSGYLRIMFISGVNDTGDKLINCHGLTVIASVVGTGDKFFAGVVDTGEQTVREQRIRLKGPKSYTKITVLVFGKRYTCVSLCSDDINENHFYVIRYKNKYPKHK